MAVNVAQLYKQSKMQTASNEEIITMLYDGAIKFCNVADSGLEAQNNELVNTNIKKAQLIISELIATLDTRYPVSADFERIYKYIMSLLVEANVKKDKEKLAQAREEIRNIRTTWLEVVKNAKGGK